MLTILLYITISIAYTVMQLSDNPEKAKMMEDTYGENWKQYAFLLSPFIMGKAIFSWIKTKVKGLPV